MSLGPACASGVVGRNADSVGSSQAPAELLPFPTTGNWQDWGYGTSLESPRHSSDESGTTMFQVSPLCYHWLRERRETVLWFCRSFLFFLPLLTQISNLRGKKLRIFFREKKLKCCFHSELWTKVLLTFSRHRILKIHLASYFTGFSVLNLFSVFFSGMSITHSTSFALFLFFQ